MTTESFASEVATAGGLIGAAWVSVKESKYLYPPRSAEPQDSRPTWLGRVSIVAWRPEGSKRPSAAGDGQQRAAEGEQREREHPTQQQYHGQSAPPRRPPGQPPARKTERNRPHRREEIPALRLEELGMEPQV